ncbi:6079_t:CDS:1, partial [Acaulospora morrowiae]
MKIYKEYYAPIEEGAISITTKTFNDVQSHIFNIGKKQRIQKENEFDKYLKASVESIDTDVLLWWK